MVRIVTESVPAVHAAEPPVPAITVKRTVMDRLSGVIERDTMRKPRFADCWAVGSRDSLKVIESYTIPCGEVTIGVASDGEVEYNLTPRDYTYGRALSDVLNDTINGIRDDYRKKGGLMDGQSVRIAAKERICRSFKDDADVDWSMNGLCDAVHRYVLGLGIFEILLSDDRIEDIYVDAPYEKNRIHAMCQHIGTAINPTGL